jgi:trans-2,3-dihydro-3-hydroxyanthranilate isomerase
VLGIDKSDIDERYPIQEASTGLSFIIVPLKSLGALKRIEVNKDRYYRLIKCTQSKAILAFCPETRDSSNDISARVFAEYYGIPEDPATGSANGALAGYLVKYRYFGKERIDIKVEQGYEVGRPSLIYLKAELRDNKIEILVGGRVLLVANGELV